MLQCNMNFSEVIKFKQKMSSKSRQKHCLLFNSLEIVSIKQENVYSTTLLRHSLLINSFHI